MIQLSPNTLTTCAGATFTNQVLSMGVGAIEEFSPNRFRFKPDARLQLQPGIQTVNVGLHAEGEGSATTSDYVTLDHCSLIVAGFTVSSVEETDTLNEYYFRVVRVDLYVDGAVAGTANINVGATTGAIQGVVSSGAIPAGTHTVKLIATSSRGTGTFTSVEEVETVSTTINCPVADNLREINVSAGFTPSRAYEERSCPLPLLTPGMPAGGVGKSDL